MRFSRVNLCIPYPIYYTTTFKLTANLMKIECAFPGQKSSLWAIFLNRVCIMITLTFIAKKSMLIPNIPIFFLIRLYFDDFFERCRQKKLLRFFKPFKFLKICCDDFSSGADDEVSTTGESK